MKNLVKTHLKEKVGRLSMQFKFDLNITAIYINYY